MNQKYLPLIATIVIFVGVLCGLRCPVSEYPVKTRVIGNLLTDNAFLGHCRRWHDLRDPVRRH